MRKPAQRPQDFRARVHDEIPQLWSNGTWIVLSQCIRRTSREIYVQFAIDVSGGTCLAVRFEHQALGEKAPASWIVCWTR